MKKPNLVVYIALVVVIIGLIFQFLEMGLFGENPIPKITKYHQMLFWGGIAIWAIGYIGKETLEKKEKDNTNID